MKEIIVVLILSLIIFGGLIFLGFLEKKKEMKSFIPSLTNENEIVRQPAVAGAFYSADKNVLQDQIKKFLEKTKKIGTKENLSVLIVPHAGYEYSGQVAAWGFKQIEGKDYKRVILLGVSHRTYFPGAAIDNSDKWLTPLGAVEIDKDFAKRITDGELIKFSSAEHQSEHSLEVELPFLQVVLSNFKIVPILLGQPSDKVLEILAQALADNFDEQTLLTISSDLSHYPSYDLANKIDKKTIDAIRRGSKENFAAVLAEQEAEELLGLETAACGAEAIKVGLIVVEKLGGGEGELIKYANSGDVDIGDKERVVGYAAIISKIKMQKSKLKIKNQKELSESQRKQLLKIARETLDSYLREKEMPEFEVEDEILNRPWGAFVTLRKFSQLRGCVGEFEPNEPLWRVVQKKAIDAALHDARFEPVNDEELKDIEIEISVLSKREKIDDWRKIELGKQGVMIKKGLRGGTFLPQVAEETGWNLETFLSNLCTQKMGLMADCYKNSDIEIFVYTAQVFSK